MLTCMSNWQLADCFWLMWKICLSFWVQDTLCPTYTQHGKKDLDTCLFSLFWLFLNGVIFIQGSVRLLSIFARDFVVSQRRNQNVIIYILFYIYAFKLLMNKNYILYYNDKKEHCIFYCLDNNTRCACPIFFSLNVFMFTFIDLY